MPRSRTQRFQELVLPHLDSAFNLACWLARNRSDAEDLVQEACLRAYRFFDGFHGDDARAWLLTIVRNTFFTWYRAERAGRHEAFSEDLSGIEGAGSATMEESDNNPETLLRQKDSERLLLRSLRELPLEFREVMVMRELEDLSYTQIATIIGIPIGTVMSRLARGRKLLAAALALSAGER